MSYSAGRYAPFIDRTTEKENYTTAVYDSMTDPLVTWLCSHFDMVKFNNLTITTDKGHRYFIGKSGADNPTFAIGWASGNTSERYIWLYIVLMYDGVTLSNVLDATGTGDPGNNLYAKKLLFRDFDNADSSNFVYFKYLKSTNFAAVSAQFNGSSPTVTSSNALEFAVFKSETTFLPCYKDGNNYRTYEYTKDGFNVSLTKTSVYFIPLKNVIANTDFNYIAQVRLEHYKPVNDLYLYSNSSLTVGLIYKINGAYYYCLTVGTSDGSYLMKLPDYAA